MIVDDRLLRVGSANLSNRSMGFDTECDLALEGRTAEEREAIRTVRDRLLAEHLGVSPEEVANGLGKSGSLCRFLDAADREGRSLRPLEPDRDWAFNDLVPEVSLADPERPASIDDLVELLVPENGERRKLREHSGRGRRLLAVLAAALGLAAIWRWTPLGDWLSLERLAQMGQMLRHQPLAPLITLSLFTIGGLVMFPVTVLVVATAMIFGPVAGILHSLGGCLASAAAGYGCGRLLGRGTVRNLAGGSLNRVSRWLSSRGVWTIALVRNLPVAPYTVVNLVAGASNIRLRDFLLGTLVGMFPGILALNLFGASLQNLLQKPSWQAGGLVGLVVTGMLLLAWAGRRYFQRQSGQKSSHD